MAVIAEAEQRDVEQRPVGASASAAIERSQRRLIRSAPSLAASCRRSASGGCPRAAPARARTSPRAPCGNCWRDRRAARSARRRTGTATRVPGKPVDQRSRGERLVERLRRRAAGKRDHEAAMRCARAARTGTRPRRAPATRVVEHAQRAARRRHHPLSPRMKRSHRLGEAVVLVAVGDRARLRLHLVAGIAHGDREAALAEHQHVVRHVADGGDLLRRDVQELRQASRPPRPCWPRDG